MKNTQENNELLPATVVNIAQWHHQRNVVAGATDESQTVKLLEEFSELVASNHPGKGPEFIRDKLIEMVQQLYVGKRFKTVSKGTEQEAKLDALGDMDVVMINILERNGWTKEESLLQAYGEIKDRKGMMISGTFVKSKDLPDYRKEIEAMGLDYDKVIEQNS